MPERQCRGCTKQTAWGCHAWREPSSEDDPHALPDASGQWWKWHNPAHLPLTFLGEETYACPRQDVLRRQVVWNRMLLFYGMYKKGHFPQVGAVLDQSNKAIEVFRVFDDVNAECEEVLEEQERIKRERAARR